jgi:prolipoprotein diacylglyceryltransferase
MYGGLIVGAAGVIWYGVKNKVPPLHLCDAAAPGLMLAYGIGRIGCQLSGDGDWGIVNTVAQPAALGWLPDWAWSYNYPHNVINEGIPIPGCEGRHCFALEQGVFPTPLYESVACILLFFVLWYFRKRMSAPGLLFSFYLLLNGIERFLVEQIRVNAKYHLGGIDFTQAQLISAMLVLIGLGGLWYFGKIRQRTSHAQHAG